MICRMHDDKATSLIKAGGQQKIHKTYVSTQNLVGASYGSVFNIIGTDLELASLSSSSSSVVAAPLPASSTDMPMAVEIGADKDNRGFNDTNTSQKLKDSDIKKMRSAGATGEDIIKTLIANSDTWTTKTEFSQEKWLKKKQRKYMKKMRVVKCTPATLCEVYHLKSRDKICHLRPDSLSQLLSCSSVYPGCRVLVIDSAIGLVVGSVAYRMRGEGQILAMYPGQQPHFDLVAALNLDEQSTDIIHPVPSNELAAAGHDVRTGGFRDILEIVPEEDAVAAPPPDDLPDHKSDEQTQTQTQHTPAPCTRSRAYNRSGRHPLDMRRSRQALREGIDALVICTRFDPLPIVKEAIVLLLPSAPFAIFFEFLEPLVEVYLYLVENQLALRLTLGDTWAREFQTLPNRVHPQMFMSTSAGYVLSGVYVGVVPTASGV